MGIAWLPRLRTGSTGRRRSIRLRGSAWLCIPNINIDRLARNGKNWASLCFSPAEAWNKTFNSLKESGITFTHDDILQPKHNVDEADRASCQKRKSSTTFGRKCRQWLEGFLVRKQTDAVKSDPGTHNSYDDDLDQVLEKLSWGQKPAQPGRQRRVWF